MREKNLSGLIYYGLESVPVEQLPFVRSLAQFQINCIVWDLDETLGDTQTPVKEQFDQKLGTDYRQREIDKFDALSFWAHEDGVLDYEEANRIETELWTDRDILSRVKPFPEVQFYSKEAAARDIIQFIVTSRVNQLKKITINWSEEHFPWIKRDNIKITPRKQLRYDSEYKTTAIAAIRPDVVFEDNLHHIQNILEVTPEATKFVWFAREKELAKINEKRVLCLAGKQQQFGQLMSHNIDTSNPLV